MRAELMSAWMSVHTELLAGRPMSPEELAARKKARDDAQAAIEREHRLLLEDVPRGGLAEDMLTLHAPNERGCCDGCNFDGYEAEPPAWPCTTYQHTAVRYGRRFAEDEYYDMRMERVT